MRSTDADARTTDPLVGEIVLLLRRIIYAPEGALNAQTRLADLSMDSLDLIEAGLELEAVLGRDLADQALREAQTVGDLARCFTGDAAMAGLRLAA